jgi:sterol desaturase/sphingolipid hydroxylase (fatty acid hydroxylase superfamily)
MPAYAIVLVFMMVAPIAALVAWLASTNAAMFVLMASMAFFLSYEWLHMSYHLPKTTFIGQSKIIGRLREFHRRHHEPRLMKRWNFNVTVPVFDVIHRTVWTKEREAERDAKRRSRRGEAAAPAASHGG